MFEDDTEAADIKRKLHDLTESMNRVRTRQADKDDVVVDMKHARLSRLEILSENLKPVFDSVPDDNEQFEFALARGETPRLWIDMTAFVRMIGDGREYEFVKDTRMGRVILGCDSDVKKIGERVSDYIAERMLERERMIEGDWIALKKTFENTSGTAHQTDEEDTQNVSAGTVGEISKPQPRRSYLRHVIWFLVGVTLGGAFLMGTVWFDQFERFFN